jgi:hypothetical protein
MTTSAPGADAPTGSPRASRNDECSPSGPVAGEAKRPSVDLGEAARYRQAQAGTARPAARDLGSDEALEDVLLLSRWDSGTLVLHGDLESALFSRPAYGWAWGRLGKVLHALGRHQEALQAFDKSIEHGFAPGVLWFDMGASAAAVKDEARLERACRELERLAPPMAEALRRAARGPHRLRARPSPNAAHSRARYVRPTGSTRFTGGASATSQPDSASRRRISATWRRFTAWLRCTRTIPNAERTAISSPSDRVSRSS